MCDAQQKQAKAMAIHLLDEESAFWLRDYCQKVLPPKFCEGQKEYFGKKGMTLLVDVIFFLDSNGDLQKNVYFTMVYRCDQDIIDSLSIANLLLDKLHKDLSTVKDLYANTDNAGSYHGNSYAKALYVMCKDKGFTLKRYEYNEPCRGKDQCNREVVRAKSLMRGYIDAGNNILTAKDVFKVLHYGKGIQNAKVACISIDTSKAKLSPYTAIPKISQYQSFDFHHDHMIMCRYFGIGEAKRWNYTNISFTFTWCCHLAV